ncbi:helix-turn-helix transcriptional regulator [Spelaeicoccus albus]|uniref:Putative ArsR family transcriptional regulator n=1 Tax=Spelaeicoccus albus TaxID=1280376 RepID=A0A7Z0CZ77_9MICO|nr:helix-turn-helix domain-containing protein [Spelaeicoccus albus]NYI66056.1 putative ArsR family transcriptional regulator [Spelaeicoccus albus]
MAPQRTDTPTGRTRTHAALGSERRLTLLDLLRESGEAMDAATLAKATDLHVTTVRFHLDALTDAGLIEATRERAARRGRPRLLFSATSKTEDDDSAGYARLAKVLASHWGDDAPSPAARAENAGRDWAAAQHLTPSGDSDLRTAAERVSTTFNELGFEAEAEDHGSEQRIILHHCPFAAVAREHPEVACAVHLGLLRGVLDSLDAPPSETSLVPFVAPNLCIAHVRAGNPSAAPATRPTSGED